MAYVPMRGLGANYDTRPPTNSPSLPPCATQMEHDSAQLICKPLSLRGLGGGLGAVYTTPVGRFGAVNPCWIASLPVCPPLPLPGPVAPPRPATHAPVMASAPPKRVVAVPPPPPATRPPVMASAPPKRVVAGPPPPPASPPLYVPPTIPVVAAAPPVSATYPAPSTEPLAPPPPTVMQQQGGMSTGGLLAIVAAAGAAGWYFFIHKKKAA